MIVMALEFRISSLRTIKRQVGGSGATLRPATRGPTLDRGLFHPKLPCQTGDG
jgi:hypothetical protein